MPTKKFALWLIAICLSWHAPAWGNQQDGSAGAEPQSQVTVNGRVTDEAGQPLCQCTPDAAGRGYGICG